MFARSIRSFGASLLCAAALPGCADQDPGDAQFRGDPTLYAMPGAGEVEFTAYAIAGFPTLDAETESSLVSLTPAHETLLVDLDADRSIPDLDLAFDGAPIAATLRGPDGEAVFDQGVPLMHGLSFPVDGDSVAALPGGLYDLEIEVDGELLFQESDVIYVPRKLDLDLDGAFTSDDLLVAFAAGKYDTGEEATWDEGDANRDGVFDSADLVDALADGGYADEAPAPPARHVDLKTAKIVAYTCWLNLWRPRATYYGQEDPAAAHTNYMDIHNVEVGRTCSSAYEPWAGPGCGAVADPVYPDPQTGGYAAAECSYNDAYRSEAPGFRAGTATINGHAKVAGFATMLCAPEFDRLDDETADREIPPGFVCDYDLSVQLSGSVSARAEGNPKIVDSSFTDPGFHAETKPKVVAESRHTLTVRYPDLENLERTQTPYDAVERGLGAPPNQQPTHQVQVTAEAKNEGCGGLLDHAKCEFGAEVSLDTGIAPHIECFVEVGTEFVRELFSCAQDAYEATDRVVIGRGERVGERIDYSGPIGNETIARYNPRLGVAQVDFGPLLIDAEYLAKSESKAAEIIAASKGVAETGSGSQQPAVRIAVGVAETSEDPRERCNVQINRTWLPSFGLAPQRRGQFQLLQNGNRVSMHLDEEYWFVSANRVYDTDDHCYEHNTSSAFSSVWPLTQEPAWLD